MWQWLVETLRTYPEIAIFLTLGLGFWVGKFKVGTFSLGVVTSTLLAGVLVGQLEITISSHVKSVFFLMFLFAVGYGVGPQFFRGLKGDGIQQVLFAVIQCVAVLVTAVVVAQVPRLRRRRRGRPAGRLQHDLRRAGRGHQQHRPTRHRRRREEGDARCHAGGLRGDLPVRHRRLGLDPGAASGRRSCAWIIAEECRKYEEEMGGIAGGQPGPPVGLHPVRAARLPADRSGLGGAHGARLRGELRRHRSRVGPVPAGRRAPARRTARSSTPKPDTLLARDAVMAIAGRREWVLEAADRLGAEVDDRELLDLELADARRGGHQQGLRRPDPGGPGDDGSGAGGPRRVPAEDPPHRRGDARHGELQAGARRYPHAGRVPRRRGARRADHRLRRPRHRGDRHGGHGRRHRHRRPDRRADLRAGRRAAQPQHQRRRADRRPRLRLAALREPHLRAHSRARRSGCSTTSA